MKIISIVSAGLFAAMMSSSTFAMPLPQAAAAPGTNRIIAVRDGCGPHRHRAPDGACLRDLPPPPPPPRHHRHEPPAPPPPPRGNPPPPPRGKMPPPPMGDE